MIACAYMNDPVVRPRLQNSMLLTHGNSWMCRPGALVVSPRVVKQVAALAALLALCLVPATASAAMVTFDFLPASTFSGTAPAGSLTAVFTDGTGAGGNGIPLGNVQLVITSALASGESLQPAKALYLNINPAKSSELSALTFALHSNSGFSQAAAVLTGEDGFKADGVGGLFDILFTYAPGTNALTAGESQTYWISTSSGTISAADFEFFSTPEGNPPWLAAVHVQKTPSGGPGSAFVGGTPDSGGSDPDPLVVSSVPAPPSAVLLAVGGFALVGLMGWRRRRQPALSA